MRSCPKKVSLQYKKLSKKQFMYFTYLTLMCVYSVPQKNKIYYLFQTNKLKLMYMKVIENKEFDGQT